MSIKHESRAKEGVTLYGGRERQSDNCASVIDGGTVKERMDKLSDGRRGEEARRKEGAAREAAETGRKRADWCSWGTT
ncbi:hypothetical protein DPV78_005272 [Talaromyces pinophilus]|nr:hypothetical protein DPV78_005272 [Talaromyces pinophilus]